jgi:hypothetical protein
MNVDEWFAASKTGLEKIARRRGLAYILFELLQNAWDTGAKVVKVTFTVVEGRARCDMTVEDDDPDGFKNLTHAWTLFAESEKKTDPSKRGKFNFGEKLVLSVCESAEIVSTTGNVRFDDEGRHVGRKRTERGSVFQGRVKMTREELGDVMAAARRLIPPPGVVTTINGEPLRPRDRVKEFESTLQTEVANEEGFLVSRQRKTNVHVYKALLQDDDGAPNGWLYEMGIPVCPTGDQWDVDIQQKVPVNIERNAVSESYLRTVRVGIVNEMFDQLKPEDATSLAVQAALTDDRITPEAVATVLTHQFGEKRALFDPSDPEANRRLVAQGYTIIPTRAFSKEARAVIKNKDPHGTRPSGQILPTPKPYSDDPNAAPARFIPESDWTPALRAMATYATEYGWKLIGKAVSVRFEKGRMTDDWGANYGAATLTFNYDRLGVSWFEQGPRESVNELLIHEFAHELEGNHLSDKFYRALQKLGAKSTNLAFANPDFFRQHGYAATRQS